MRVLIVDDHEVVRRGIRSLLSRKKEVEVCGEAVDGEEAIAKARELRPDVITMDISMPRLNGLEATRVIRQEMPEVQILILSQHDVPEMVRLAFKAGADGYVVKSALTTQLVAALDSVRSGAAAFGLVAEDGHKIVDTQEILERAKTFETSLRETEQQLSQLLDHQRQSRDELVRAKREIEISGEYMELVTSMMAAAVTRCSRDLRHVWANQRYADWLEQPLAAIVGKPIEEVLGKEAFEALRPRFDLVLSGREVRYESEIGFRSIGRRWIEATYRPTRDGAGKTDGWVAVIVDVTERKKREDAASAALSALSAQLQRARDEERRRIARDLHDSVGQLLTTLTMHHARVAEERNALTAEAVRALDRTTELIGQALREVRTISHLLHPPLLDGGGLSSALRWYIDGFVERSKLGVRLECAEDLGRLPDDQELSLFRIVQECLTNVHKHSGSGTAVVRLLRRSDDVVLEVRDEGRGLPPEARAMLAAGEGGGGVGLRGMRERVRQIGGTFSVQSDGVGTAVLVSLPVPSARDARSVDASADCLLLPSVPPGDA